jgi:flagellar biosynthesis protein FlhG
MQTLRIDQADGIRRMAEPKPVRVLAIASGKGGVGKTNISANLAIGFTELGRQVALMDADMGLANIDVLLGLQPAFNLSHMLTGERTLEEIIVQGPAGLKIVPAASGMQKMSQLSAGEQAGIIRAFSEINQDLDVFIVDTAAGISSGVVNFARACQNIIVIVCDEPTSLTDAYAFIKLLSRDYGVFGFQIIANMVADAQHGQSLFSKLCKVADRYLDVALNYIGAIPQDDYLRKAVQKQAPVILAYPHSRSAQAFKSLARKLDAMPIAPHVGGQLEFFVERMICYSNSKNAVPV